MSPRELEERAERSAAPGIVQVWHGTDRFWRYRYVHSPRGTKIESNRGYITRDEAVESARVAYPGVPVVQLVALPEGETRRRSSFVRAAIKLGLLAAVMVSLRKALRMILRVRGLARKAGRVARMAAVVSSLWRREDRTAGGGSG